MKHLRKYNENKALKYRQDKWNNLIDTIKESLVEFKDSGWQWTSSFMYRELLYSNEIISIGEFPSFCCKMFKIDKDVDDSSDVDWDGHISPTGSIVWECKKPRIIKSKELEEETEDFLVAVKRINSATGIEFRFAYMNDEGEKRITIEGSI